MNSENNDNNLNKKIKIIWKSKIRKNKIKIFNKKYNKKIHKKKLMMILLNKMHKINLLNNIQMIHYGMKLIKIIYLKMFLICLMMQQLI